MRSSCSMLLLVTLGAGCSSVKTPPMSGKMVVPASAAIPAAQVPARPVGRPIALRDVEVGQHVTILQFIDSTETWVTGQVEESTAERLTLVNCHVEERKPGKTEAAVTHTRASRYSLPPDEVRKIRAV